jgi:hypothetical protein
MRYYQGDVERLVLKICFRRPRKTANPPNSSVSALAAEAGSISGAAL